MQKLSELLSLRRTEKKMSLKELSEKTGISSFSLSKYEKGLRLPDVSNINKIATALELDYDEVYNILTAEKNAKKA